MIMPVAAERPPMNAMSAISGCCCFSLTGLRQRLGKQKISLAVALVRSDYRTEVLGSLGIFST